MSPGPSWVIKVDLLPFKDAIIIIILVIENMFAIVPESILLLDALQLCPKKPRKLTLALYY